jgi:hypothetical protein
MEQIKAHVQKTHAMLEELVRDIEQMEDGHLKTNFADIMEIERCIGDIGKIRLYGTGNVARMTFVYALQNQTFLTGLLNWCTRVDHLERSVEIHLQANCDPAQVDSDRTDVSALYREAKTKWDERTTMRLLDSHSCGHRARREAISVLFKLGQRLDAYRREKV